MNTEHRPIIPARIRALSHFDEQKQIIWINTFGMKIQISIVEKNGQGKDTVLLAFNSQDLEVKVRDSSLLRLDEFRFLQDVVDNQTYESFLVRIKVLDGNTDYICACYYLEDLKRRHGENIDTRLLFEAIRRFKFPKE